MRDFPPLLTAAEMRAADTAATSRLGVPSMILMENAGRGIADVVRRELEGAGGAPPGAGDVAIVCGAGTNGGDGFVAARHLARAGVAVRVALTAPPVKVGGDAAVMRVALERMGGVPIADGSGWTGEAAWREWLAGAGVVVDAIFGTGFRGAITGVPAAALAAMNAARARKLAVDVPSGLDADTGRATGPVFRADVTATMGACKVGLYVDADAPVGRVEVVELGVPILTDDGRGRAQLPAGRSRCRGPAAAAAAIGAQGELRPPAGGRRRAGEDGGGGAGRTGGAARGRRSRDAGVDGAGAGGAGRQGGRADDGALRQPGRRSTPTKRSPP